MFFVSYKAFEAGFCVLKAKQSRLFFAFQRCSFKRNMATDLDHDWWIFMTNLGPEKSMDNREIRIIEVGLYQYALKSSQKKRPELRQLWKATLIKIAWNPKSKASVINTNRKINLPHFMMRTKNDYMTVLKQKFWCQPHKFIIFQHRETKQIDKLAFMTKKKIHSVSQWSSIRSLKIPRI